ncbi:hypothetical protein BST11_26610 [Mycobacterium alsense]|uniref:DUF732 domain-containing protein n=1 Tax=Mycobacterium alsense TaxID=324058 RepID=A0AA41XV19_9MYCO|nr:DUF732 domain-containing protein [Mycobacterium alsense]MCV7381454.1 DUF732 domain-containing protein [Mycobacterium alsense]OQZ87721.1 hypothetical protein BST11_26610 [Mycobacterium alsense]
MGIYAEIVKIPIRRTAGYEAPYAPLGQTKQFNGSEFIGEGWMCRKFLFATAAMVAAAVGAIPVASADPDSPDPGTYLFMLREYHIPFTSENDAIAGGLAVCQHVRAGESAGVIVQELRDRPSNALTYVQAANVVVAATEQLCPEAPPGAWYDAMIMAGRSPEGPN